jgi:Na+-driven multidrug efflux pump
MLQKLIYLVLPSAASMFSGTIVFLADMYFVGWLGDVDVISGVGLGTMVVNLFGYQTFVGLNGALETLVP